MFTVWGATFFSLTIEDISATIQIVTSTL